MVTDVITVDAGLNIKEAVRKMNEYVIGSLIVTEKGRVVGILTERDILARVVYASKNPNKALIRDVMSKPLIIVDPEANLEDAIDLMFKNKIKKLPVVKGEKLVGLVTITDVARIHPVMVDYIKNHEERHNLPKRMEKVIQYYVV